ncbi:related to NWD2 protein-Podospora anserina [Serendipita indica DSM 11827]|uniref:Related to NWD2 protein-Podospora anserina n=1 Tax=Serendipita indica (strain DSM 11827) TaxID=1109443 RepID=G4TZ28_SERID|nr:related to NWD2 protein-Podospora anserina [Serendipita indica DSM 11827]
MALKRLKESTSGPIPHSYSPILRSRRKTEPVRQEGQTPDITVSTVSSVHNTCLEGTRKDVLEMIWDWADNGSSDRPIFWLCDIAGSGKSTVAMSAVQKWRKKGVLGGGFFFSMSSNEASNIEKFCSTIARDLADHIPDLAPRVAQAVKQNPSIMRKPLLKQFQTLVVGPVDCRQESVILVIDALDECKASSQRRELVETLSTAVRGTTNLKIFMTSRPDPVIQAVLGPLSTKAKLAKLEDRLHDVSHRDNIDDIAVYVHRSLDGVLPEYKRRRLVGKANGLFIWASTACRMLTDEATMNTAEGIYDQLISLDQPGAIDEVYSLILERTDPNSGAVMCQMLAILLAAFEPLTINDLDDRLKHAGIRGSGQGLVQNLGSVLSTDPSTALIQFRHPSLVEYLRRCSTQPVGSSKKFSIDTITAHGQAASWCLKRLKSPTDGLRFNICQIELSFYLNRQLPDLKAGVSKYISKSLRYASSHWLFRMSETDEKWRRTVEREAKSVLRVPHALYWTEVLSLTGGVPRAIAGLRAATHSAGVSEIIQALLVTYRNVD